MLTDREVLNGLFGLVGALAEKLTGEVPVVTFETATGEKIACVADRSTVRWVKWSEVHNATVEALRSDRPAASSATNPPAP